MRQEIAAEIVIYSTEKIIIIKEGLQLTYITTNKTITNHTQYELA